MNALPHQVETAYAKGYISRLFNDAIPIEAGEPMATAAVATANNYIFSAEL